MSPVPRRILLLVGCGLLLVAVLAGVAAGVGAGGPKSHINPTAPLAGAGAVEDVGGATAEPPAPVPLTSGWGYRADPHNLGIAAHWEGGGGTWAPVTIPNDFNAVISARSDAGTIGWYEVRFTGPPVTAGRSWRVAFESVRRTAQVWLNGHEIGSSSDPYAPFSLPASTLIPGGQNLLVVRVDNIRGPDALPEDWWNWGGIMGPVSLQPAGRLALTDLGVLPQLSCAYRCGRLLITATLRNDSAGPLTPVIAVRVTSPSGAQVVDHHAEPPIAAGASIPVSFRVAVDGQPALWSPASPSLYPVEVQAGAGGRIEQADSLDVGMRSVQVRGGILYLNGRRLWLHGAAIHEDIQGRGAALTDSDIETIVYELRSVGANITRAHYLLSPRLLDALDQAGIMVWAQPPVDHADGVLQTPAGRTRALSLLRSTLIGDRNHPSVVIDSVGNELSPVPDTVPGTREYLNQAIALARRLNPGIPVGLDTYCYPGFPAQRIYAKLNVLGISSYFGWYAGPLGHSTASFDELEPFLRLSHTRYPWLALAVSEFGAESLFAGPATVKGSYDFQSNYIRETLGVLDRLPFMNGSIYWTLREFAVAPGWRGGATLPPGYTSDDIHHKGLIAYDGSDKPAFAVLSQLFETTPAFVH